MLYIRGMQRANKIVRVIKITNTYRDKSDWTYEIYLTTFKEYQSSITYKTYGTEIKLKPYKFYELQWLWTHPSFRLLMLLETLTNKALSRNNKIIIASNSIIFIMESVAAWFIVEFLKLVIGLQSDLIK